MASWSDYEYRQWHANVTEDMDILDALPENFNIVNYCSRNYLEFEERAVKYLQSQKWQMICRFETSESDSFGPMMRVAKFRKPNGTVVALFHG